MQDLAEASKTIFKSLRGKGKMTEKQLKYFTIVHKKTNNLGKMYLLPKITTTEDFLMFLADQLYRTVTHLPERFRSFGIVILKVLCKKALNHFTNKTKNLKDITKMHF